MKYILFIFSLLAKVIDRICMHVCKYSLAEVGKNVIFHPTNSTFSYGTISIGNDVGIGERACFVAAISHIRIGNHIAFAPNVTIRGGNHRYDIVGKWITDYKKEDKRPEDDQDVFIEDDCWIGTNVVILKGVTIGRGSIVAAGAVVNKSCPPYSIVGGIPAKVLKFRFTKDEIIAHEKQLYSEESRYTLTKLQEIRDEYDK